MMGGTSGGERVGGTAGVMGLEVEELSGLVAR